MNSYADPVEVLDDLGDKFLQSFVSSVDGARSDLQAFQVWQPSWFPSFTQRFISNFIHERIWTRMTVDLDDSDSVVIVDEEPRRELASGKYVMRIKRHKLRDRIQNYPTRSSLEFWTHGSALDGLETVSLAIGYRWDEELKDMREPIVSFRDGKDKPIWAVRFPEPGEGVQPIHWEPVTPTDPTLDLSTILRVEDDQTGSE